MRHMDNGLSFSSCNLISDIASDRELIILINYNTGYNKNCISAVIFNMDGSLWNSWSIYARYNIGRIEDIIKIHNNELFFVGEHFPFDLIYACDALTGTNLRVMQFKTPLKSIYDIMFCEKHIYITSIDNIIFVCNLNGEFCKKIEVFIKCDSNQTSEFDTLNGKKLIVDNKLYIIEKNNTQYAISTIT
jgi:hypothetical protein